VCLLRFVDGRSELVGQSPGGSQLTALLKKAETEVAKPQAKNFVYRILETAISRSNAVLSYNEKIPVLFQTMVRSWVHWRGRE